jgi:hypothetical protein
LLGGDELETKEEDQQAGEQEKGEEEKPEAEISHGSPII